MALSGNQLHYFIGSTVAFVVSGLIAGHLWPVLKDRPQGTVDLAVVNLPMVVFVHAFVRKVLTAEMTILFPIGGASVGKKQAGSGNKWPGRADRQVNTFPYLLRYGRAVSELTIANTFSGKRLSA